MHNDEQDGAPQPARLREGRSQAGTWRVPSDLRRKGAAVVNAFAWQLERTTFYAPHMDTLGRSFHERTARLLVAFKTDGPFTPLLMDFLAAVEIDGVRYRRVRDECDLCSPDGEGYCAVFTIAMGPRAFFPRSQSEDLEFVFRVPDP